MKDVKIIPLLNQAAPGVWDDMCRVQGVTTQIVYNKSVDPRKYEIELREEWRKYKFSFAFGAYLDDEMVGFIRGDVRRRTATIQDVYVLPDYHKLHIGKQLVSAAENAVSIKAHHIDLVSFWSAMDFYRKLGYVPVPGKGFAICNKMGKRVTPSGVCQVVPVFYPTARVVWPCVRIAQQHGATFGKSFVDCRSDAMLVYIGADCNLRGYLVGTPNVDGGGYELREMHADKSSDQGWVKTMLMKKFDDLNDFYKKNNCR